jgi:hypothetical protein
VATASSTCAQDSGDGERRQDRRADERDAPAERLAQPRRERHAHDVGHAQPEQDAGDGAGLEPGRREVAGDQRRHAEVGAVRQPGEEARAHERGVRGGGGAQHVADGVGHHQRDQQGAARQLGAESGQHRRPDHHTERVGADHVPGGGDRDVDAAGDLRQQAHGHELGRADREAAQRQGEQREAQVRVVGSWGGGRRDRRGGLRAVADERGGRRHWFYG